MASISGLSVRVSAAVSDFTTGMSRAQDAAGDVALSLRRLSSASESAESNLDEVGNSALRASGGMTTFGISTEGAGFSVRGLSASILVSLVPALVTLSAALVPVVSALGGFVAIAGAITGIGLVGVLGAAHQNTEQLKTAFQALVSEVMAEFAPVFEAATSVLLTLLDALTRTISELVPSQNVIETVASAFERLGLAVIGALPAFADLAASLAQEFLPAFVDLVKGALQEAPGFIEMLVADFRELAPLFVAAGGAVADLLGEMRKFGFVALRVVAAGVGRLAGGLTDTLRAVNDLDRGMQNLVAQASVLAPVIFTLTSLFGGLSVPVVAAAAAVGALFSAWQMNFGNIRGIVASTVSELQTLLGDRVPKLVSSARQAFETWRPVLEPLFNFLAQTLGVVVVNAVDSVVSVTTALFQLLSGDISGAVKTLGGLFKRTFGRIGDLILDTFSGLSGAAVSAIKSLGKEIGNILEDAVEAAFTPSIDIGPLSLFGPGGGDFTPSPQTGTVTQGPGVAPSELVEAQGGGQQNVTVDNNVTVSVDDRGQLQAFVDSEINQEFENRQRNTNRETGRTPNL